MIQKLTSFIYMLVPVIFPKIKMPMFFLKKKHPQEKNMSMFFEGKKSLEKYDPPKKIQDNPVIQVTVAAVFFFNGG